MGAAAQSGVQGSRSTATLAVQVLDSAGAPVPHADVMLPKLRTGSRTNERGLVRIDSLPAGATLLSVRRLGFYPHTQTVALHAGQQVAIVVTLESAASLMDTLVAEARSLADKMRGFDRRRAAGIGIFLTRQQIEQRNAISMRDLMRGLPEVVILNPGIKFARTAASDCLPEYYVDGTPVRSISTDDFTPNEVEGIELYRGPSEVPAHLLSKRSACGLVMIWTRTP